MGLLKSACLFGYSFNITSKLSLCKEADKLKSQDEATNQEIDVMVYELYGLVKGV